MSDTVKRMVILKLLKDERHYDLNYFYLKENVILEIALRDVEYYKFKDQNIPELKIPTINNRHRYLQIAEDVPIDKIDEFANTLEKLDENIIQLNKKETLEVVFKLTKDKQYIYSMFQKILPYLHSNTIKSNLEKIWETIDIGEKMDPKFSLKISQLLLRLLEIEGRNSKAHQILKRTKKSLSEYEKDKYDEITLKFLIEDEVQEIKLQIDKTSMKPDAYLSMLKSVTTKYDKRIELIENVAKQTFEEVQTQIRKHDIIITDERKESLQKQIDLTQKSIDRTHSMTRNFLIIISILMGIITGTFIWLLVEVWNYLAST